MDEEVDDVEQDIGQLSYNAQVVHEKLAVFRLGLAAGTLQLVIDEIPTGRREGKGRRREGKEKASCKRGEAGLNE